MNLILLGLSHHTAPVELREQLAIPDARLESAVRQLLAEPEVAEGLILSTCNRVEILACGLAAEPRLRPFLGRLHDRDLAPFAPYLYERRADQAVRHVFRVAASLDSLVIGEPQILGQLKQAYAVARAAGGVRGTLASLLGRAFSAAKRVRSETALARQSLSVSHAAVDLACQIFGSLAGKIVLLIGAGDMGALAARYLLDQGAAQLLIASRNVQHAQALVAKCGGESFGLDQLQAQGHRADVIIACANAPQPLLTKADVAAFLARRRARPQLLLDIAVPRDIDPQVEHLANAFLFNIDDLQSVVDANLAGRQREALRAEAILEEEIAKFLRDRRRLEVAPLIKALQQRSDGLRRDELRRLAPRLAALSAEQRRVVENLLEDLTDSLMRKWLHRPLVELKAAAGDAADIVLADAVQRIFGLGAEPNADPNVPVAVAAAAPDSPSSAAPPESPSPRAAVNGEGQN